MIVSLTDIVAYWCLMVAMVPLPHAVCRGRTHPSLGCCTGQVLSVVLVTTGSLKWMQSQLRIVCSYGTVLMLSVPRH